MRKIAVILGLAALAIMSTIVIIVATGEIKPWMEPVIQVSVTVLCLYSLYDLTLRLWEAIDKAMNDDDLTLS